MVATTHNARPAPPTPPAHRVVGTAPEPVASGRAAEPLAVNRPAGGEEERVTRPVQHDLVTAGEAPVRPTLAPAPEATAVVRPADDRQPAPAPPSPFGAEAVETIVHQTRLTRAPGHTALRLHLRPAELGEVQVTIDVSARGAAIHVVASTPDGQAAVERGLPTLRGALASAGLDPDRLTLTTGHGSPGVAGSPTFDLSHQGRSWQEHTPARFVFTPAPAAVGARLEEPASSYSPASRDSQLDIRI
jgi:hypothetical protein